MLFRSVCQNMPPPPRNDSDTESDSASSTDVDPELSSPAVCEPQSVVPGCSYLWKANGQASQGALARAESTFPAAQPSKRARLLADPLVPVLEAPPAVPFTVLGSGLSDERETQLSGAAVVHVDTPCPPRPSRGLTVTDIARAVAAMNTLVSASSASVSASTSETEASTPLAAGSKKASRKRKTPTESMRPAIPTERPLAGTSPVLGSCILSLRGNVSPALPQPLSSGGATGLANPEVLSAGYSIGADHSGVYSSAASPAITNNPDQGDLYQFNQAHLLSFGNCLRVRGMTVRQRERLGRRDMAYLLSNACLRPRLAIHQQIISPQLLYRIWRRALARLMHGISCDVSLDSEMSSCQEQRVVAMMSWLQRLERSMQ